MNYKEICGCIHLHTTFSDGGIDFPGMISAAQQVGLDYIIITDHMNLKGLFSGFEGFHNDLLVIVGYEHNDKDNRNHYLALGTDRVVDSNLEPHQYVSAIKKAGGIGFLAHPAEKRNYFGKLPPYPWTRWDVTDFNGIELWNQMSDWIEQLKNFRSFIRLFYPRRYLGNVPEELLQKWDELNQHRFVSGIGGVDAHTRKLRFGPISYTVFPIKVELKGIRTHLYVKTHDKGSVLTALKNGNSFISNFRQGNAKGTRIYVECRDGSILPPGKSESTPALPARLTVALPDSATIRFIKNGNCVSESQGKKGELRVDETGVYRVEVLHGKSAWIYSNPFPFFHK